VVLQILTIYFIDDYKDCSYPFGYIRVTFVSICIFFRLVSEISERLILLKVCGVFMSLLFFLTWVILATFFYIANLVKTSGCVTVGTFVVDGLFVGLMLFSVLFVFVLMMTCVVVSFKKLRKSGEFKKQLKAVYNNIYSKNFDAEDFICKNKEVIDTLPLEPEEHAIIKDLFTYKYIPDKEYMPDICTIC